jgi:RNA polymerase sigma-70 factor (ECF subfamily)
MLDSLSLKAEQDLDMGRSRNRITPEHLFEDHFEAVHRYFVRRTSSLEDAQDLTAETFAATIDRPVPRKVEPLSWLYGIARRKLADHLRKRRGAIPKAPDQRDHGSTDRAIAIRLIVDRLPDDQREALLLQSLEGLSVEQIGVAMGRSAGSVKALLQRAKERVRSEGEAEFGQEAMEWK